MPQEKSETTAGALCFWVGGLFQVSSFKYQEVKFLAFGGGALRFVVPSCGGCGCFLLGGLVVVVN